MQAVPTPNMAMPLVRPKDDTREWVLAFQGGGNTRILAEFIPKGDNIKQWNEMFIQQIDFTKASLRDYVNDWKAMLLKADPKITITETKLADGSFLMTFLSVASAPAQGEEQVRRFIREKDAIYQMSYSVRPSLRNEDKWKSWVEAITQARLVKNPIKQPVKQRRGLPRLGDLF